MVRAMLALIAAFVLLVTPHSVRAWGMDVHRWLTRQALDGLPGELKPFFAMKRDLIVEHAVDPDLWRVVGLKTDVGAEDPNHFFDVDDLGERPPFANVPRTWADLVAKYGVERANKAGRLPWRAEEMYALLVARFQDLAKPNPPPYAADNAHYLAAVLSHYIEDAHQPFHATVNFDGQLTNQRGIHSRFETELVLRYQATLRLAPVTTRPIDNIRDFMFETIIDSHALVAPLLERDRRAAMGREFYDDAYFAALFEGTRPLLEKRLSEASSAVASVIVNAWKQAGRPKLPVAVTPRPPGRIGRTPLS
jgi:hypothetical protein